MSSDAGIGSQFDWEQKSKNWLCPKSFGRGILSPCSGCVPSRRRVNTVVDAMVREIADLLPFFWHLFFFGNYTDGASVDV